MSILFLFKISLYLLALPPLAQDIKEIQTILSSNELSDRLHSGESIQSISKIEGGYLIITSASVLEVHVQYLGTENGVAGPQKFSLEFVEIC